MNNFCSPTTYSGKASRRHFILQMIGLSIGTSLVRAQVPLARLDVSPSTLNGTNVTRVLMTYSPSDTVWELQLSNDLGSPKWANISPTNFFRHTVVSPGRTAWDVPAGMNPGFFRSKLVATNSSIKLPSGSSYNTPATGQTLLEAMTLLKASASSFTFDSQYFTNIGGQFVLGINGLQNAEGSYWTLYVNGKELDVGISGYILKPRDKIEWRYEKRS